MVSRPNPGFHVSNARAVTEPYGSTGRIAMVLAYGDDGDLDADGRMPPPVRPPEPERDVSQEEEEEDPPGALTFNVVKLRKAYLRGKMDDGVWIRVYARVRVFTLKQVGDTVTEVRVIQVTEKYVVCDGDACLPIHSEPEFQATQQASDDEWDVPEVQTGDRFAAIILSYDDQANEVLMATKPDEYSAILVEPVDHLHRLCAGDELLNVEVIGFRGPNLVCRGPEDLHFEEVPNDTGSDPRPLDRGNRGPSSPPPQPNIPSLGLLRDDHWRRTRSRPPCTHYPHGTCNQGDCVVSSTMDGAHRQAGGFVT